MYYVYIVQNSDGELYIGVSQNPQQRLKEHNSHRGSVFTKAGNFRIVFTEEHQSLSKARQREIQIKKWRRDKKQLLINRYQQGLPTKL